MKTLFLAGALALAVIGFTPQTTQAASGPQTMMPGAQVQSILEPAQYRGRRCRFWRRECRRRWGYNWRFRRCMVLHGCF